MQPFQELVDEYWRDVARLCHAIVGREEGDDAAQRAWEKALAAYPPRRATNIAGWLFAIATNAALDEHRARKRRPALLAQLPDIPAEPPDRRDDVLWKNVRALPGRQRAAIALRYVMDRPHEDVARALGTTTQASRRLVSDALAALRTTMGET